MGCVSAKTSFDDESRETTMNGSKRIPRLNILVRLFRRKSNLRTIHEVRPGLEFSSSKENVPDALGLEIIS